LKLESMMKNKIDTGNAGNGWKICLRRATLASKNSYIFHNIFGIYGFLVCENNIPGKKMACTKRAHEYEVSASTSHIVSNNETKSPS